MELPKRRLGRTGIDVTILGLGGEGILRTFGHEHEAYQLINRAIDLGMNYFESARAYAGSESYYGLSLKERRKELFLTSKSHARDRKGAMTHLIETLKNMKTDYLDLWQVHDVRTEEEVDEIFGKNGAIEAFEEAREKGMVRFIGVTGHHYPPIILNCLQKFDFDTVLIPVNPAEPAYNSFIEKVIPAATQRDMGIIAMKVYFHGLAAHLSSLRLESFYRYALSCPVTTAVIGCDNIKQIEENIRFASSFIQMTKVDMANLTAMVSPNARRLMYYKL